MEVGREKDSIKEEGVVKPQNRKGKEKIKGENHKRVFLFISI